MYHPRYPEANVGPTHNADAEAIRVQPSLSEEYEQILALQRAADNKNRRSPAHHSFFAGHF
jgi:hypothetical protein